MLGVGGLCWTSERTEEPRDAERCLVSPLDMVRGPGEWLSVSRIRVSRRAHGAWQGQTESIKAWGVQSGASRRTAMKRRRRRRGIETHSNVRAKEQCSCSQGPRRLEGGILLAPPWLTGVASRRQTSLHAPVHRGRRYHDQGAAGGTDGRQKRQEV
jgi:hypothetical protein